MRRRQAEAAKVEAQKKLEENAAKAEREPETPAQESEQEPQVEESQSEEPATEQEPQAEEPAKETPPVLRESQLKQMNKDELVEYAAGFDLALDSKSKKEELIEAILAYTVNQD
jgi:hypothetical protein